jgi:hypothetical protein
MERCRVYYKGEGGGFPQVRAVVSLVCPCYPWLVLAPKVLQLCTNHLMWVVCRPVWVSEACQLFLVPLWSSNTPFYPSKCYELGSVPQLLPLLLSCTWTHFWVLQGVGSASSFNQHVSTRNLIWALEVYHPLQFCYKLFISPMHLPISTYHKLYPKGNFATIHLGNDNSSHTFFYVSYSSLNQFLFVLNQ